ncbi:MAG: hypothetical protein ABFD49_07915 [Armatimonadota bacterium]|nr:hypothetical protein [bacterium]
MSLAKLKQIHVIIIGAFLCIAAVVGVIMLLVKPKQEALAAAQARVDRCTLANTSAENKAVQDLNNAIMEVGRVQQSLDAEMKRRMPDLSFARRDLGMLQLWHEQIDTLGPLLESFAKDKSVRVLNASFSIPAPPANPNDAVFDQDVLVFPLGNVTVQGNFKALMANIRRWNNCSRLVMVNQPVLMGTSPNLTATYSLTCYIFPVAKGGEKIQMAGAGGASAGAAGAAPMPGGPSMPGAPGM